MKKTHHLYVLVEYSLYVYKDVHISCNNVYVMSFSSKILGGFDQFLTTTLDPRQSGRHILGFRFPLLQEAGLRDLRGHRRLGGLAHLGKLPSNFQPSCYQSSNDSNVSTTFYNTSYNNMNSFEELVSICKHLSCIPASHIAYSVMVRVFWLIPQNHLPQN